MTLSYKVVRIIHKELAAHCSRLPQTSPENRVNGRARARVGPSPSGSSQPVYARATAKGRFQTRDPARAPGPTKFWRTARSKPLASSCARAVANSAGSGATRSPVSPGRTLSVGPPLLTATTGRRAYMASIGTMPKCWVGVRDPAGYAARSYCRVREQNRAEPSTPTPTATTNLVRRSVDQHLCIVEKERALCLGERWQKHYVGLQDLGGLRGLNHLDAEASGGHPPITHGVGGSEPRNTGPARSAATSPGSLPCAEVGPRRLTDRAHWRRSAALLGTRHSRGRAGHSRLGPPHALTRHSEEHPACR